MTKCDKCGGVKVGSFTESNRTPIENLAFCECDKPERSATEEELYAFNEGHRNELMEFLRKQTKVLRLHWLNWWKYYINGMIESEEK